MVRMPAFNHPTCSVPNCGAHFYPRRKGPHLFAEVVIPTPGDVQAVVYRALHDDGHREAFVLAYSAGCWSDRLPLPSKPRKAHAAAVSRARLFVRTGALVP